MREIRIFDEAELVEGIELTLGERATGHLVRVLRRRVGERFTLFDGRGTEAEAELIEVPRRGSAVARLGAVRAIDRESQLGIELVQALARGEKMDWVVQKAVELGVAAIHPVLTERSEVRPDDGGLLRKQQRWREIAIGACEQCGRNRLPSITAPVPLSELRVEAGTRLMLDLDRSAPLAGIDRPDGGVALAIGPEGGFGERDRVELHAAGFRAVRLGPRVLRTETAGPAAIAVLQTLFGDLGASG